jgi:7-cyano-7-deazaguanine synthase
VSERKKAVVLLSGGLDSTTVLAIVQQQKYEVFAISFRYGQRHEVELECARNIATAMKVDGHLIVDFDLRSIGGSALTGAEAIPQDRSSDEMAGGIPVTYVPARNTIFLSFALAWAEVLGSEDIFIGVNALDYSGYPDCRPEYIQAFEKMANLATKAAVEGTAKLTIHTPLIAMSKAEIIATGLRLGLDYSLTHSCYDPRPSRIACGRCDSCVLRLKGFAEAGERDPLSYADR